TDPVAARIRSCLELEALGCKTAPIAVDVADPKAFAAALAEAEQNLGLGPVCDVIHSAGLVGADVFQTLDDPALSPSLTAQLAAKGKALDVLSTLFRDRPAGLRLLFSSVAARFGGTGLAAYGAANAHVDAFARLRAEEGWCAIAWDAWSLAGERWQSGTLTEADGLAALGHLLALPDQAQLVVLARPAEGRTAKRADIQAEQAVGSEADAPGAEALSTGPALENDAQRKVAAVFAEVLGVSDPGQDADFLQLGGDSLIAVQAVSRLKLAFGPGVRIDMLFEAPRLADLASMLDGLDGLEGAPSETPSDEDLEEGEL
ncbi:MAG: SDR family NAD(P)-dependent oxidoreductase, partial [Rhodospirillaceae bacterium]